VLERVLARRLLDVVPHIDRYFGDLEVVVADLDQYLRAGRHPRAVEVNYVDRTSPIGPEAALGVHDLHPGRNSCSRVEHLHADLAVPRDMTARRLLEKARPDDDIRLMREYRFEDFRDIAGEMLTVGVEDDEGIDVHGPGHIEDGLESCAVALVLLVTDDRCTHPLRDLGRLIGGAVVDDDYTIDKPLCTEDRLRDVEFLVEGRHRGDDVRGRAVVLRNR